MKGAVRHTLGWGREKGEASSSPSGWPSTHLRTSSCICIEEGKYSGRGSYYPSNGEGYTVQAESWAHSDGKTASKGSPGPKHEGRHLGGTRKSKLRDRHRGGVE